MLKELQTNLLNIRKDLEPLQIAYYDAETEEQEDLIQSQLEVLENNKDKTIKDLKDYCYKILVKNGQLSTDIKELFEKSKKNVVIENKLVDLLLTM